DAASAKCGVALEEAIAGGTTGRRKEGEDSIDDEHECPVDTNALTVSCCAGGWWRRGRRGSTRKRVPLDARRCAHRPDRGRGYAATAREPRAQKHGRTLRRPRNR